MPDVIGRIPDSKYRTGLHGAQPLEKRFQAAKDWALRHTPVHDEEYSAIHQLMISESNIDNLYAIAERAKARHTPVIDPQLRAAWNEISRLEHQFNQMVRELREAQQKWLWRAQSDWRQKVLRSLQPDMGGEIATIDTDWVGDRKYPDIITARQRAKAVHEQIKWLEGLSSKVFNAMAFDESPPEIQAVHLCHGLYDDSIELITRIAALEQQISKLTVQVGRLQRSINPKPRKAA